MNNEHIHTPGDGRGKRKIFVDGVRVNRVFYADTKRGIVRAYRQPTKLRKYGKRLITRTIRGNVTVTLYPRLKINPAAFTAFAEMAVAAGKAAMAVNEFARAANSGSPASAK